MRIISPYRDYYDTAQGFGADQTRVFVRKPKVHAKAMSQVPSALSGLFSEAREDLSYSWGAGYALVPLVFCGKLYRAVRITHRTRDRVSLIGQNEEVVHYDLKAAHNWAKDRGLVAVADSLGSRLKKGRTFPGPAEAPAVAGAARDWLIENRVAVLVGDPAAYGSFLTENAPLAPLQFYKVFDAAQAYQELDMFLSGVLAAENRPMTPIPDNIRAQQRGFDRLSFRQAPTKRRG